MRMRLISHILSGLVLALAVPSAAFAQTDDATVTARLVAFETVQAGSKTTISNDLNTLSPTGTWADVDYADTAQTMWNPATHTARLLDMARAYQLPSHALYRSAALSNAIHRALGAFTSRDPQSSNWWYNDIDSPQKIGRTLLLLGAEASAGEVAAATTILNRSKLTGLTGQNLMWEAGNVLVKGLVLNSNAAVSGGAAAIVGLYVTTTNEGVQFDGSFQQHGPQLYTGGYGAGFGDDGAMWQDTLRGTAWAATPAQVDVLSRYLLDGVRWPIWAKSWDFSVTGRGISRGAQGATGMADAFLHMTNLAPALATELVAFSKGLSGGGVFGGVLSGERHFWCSDETIHRRTNWFCSIRGCSARVQGSECGNGEGLADYYLGDGLMSLQRDGGEYYQIPAVWNWRKLPGVTCPQKTGALPVLGWSGYLGGSGFVGGVCDGTNGTMVMDLSRDGLTMKKAWLVYDDTVLCLGAGVKYTNDTSVVATTVNQCLWRSNAVLRTSAGTQTLGAGTYALTNASWLHQDGIGYLPLDAGGGTFRLTLQPQTGTWYAINDSRATDLVSSAVFTLWADHGTKPSTGSYAYAVFPNATTSAMPALAAAPPFVILNNSTQAQAAFFTAPGVLQAVFHGAGSVTSPAATRISVDVRCALMAKLLPGSVTVSAARPDQAAGALTVRVSRALSGAGATWLSASRETRLVLPMPQGSFAGSTTSFVYAAVAEAAPAVDSDYGADAFTTRATLNGSLTAGEPADVRVVWNAQDRGTSLVAWTNSILLPGLFNGPFGAEVTGLAPGASLVYRCYASNALGTAWSAARTFRLAPTVAVSNLAGLALWLEAGDPAGTGVPPADRSAVTNWVDKSGYGRNARGTASTNDWPRYRATNFNGRAALNFNGTNYLDCGNIPLYDNATGMTLVAVCRMADETDKAILSKDNWTANQREWVLHSSDFQIQEATNAMNAANRVTNDVVTNACCLAGRWQPRVRTELFRDGDSLGVAATPTTNMTATTTHVLVAQANNVDATRYLTGDIAEIAVYARALDTNDLHRLCAGLAAKYGLAYAFDFQNPDADGDGIPDAWERATYGGVDLVGSGDTDGDGMSDPVEWQAGTDPLDRNSLLRCEGVFRLSAGLARLSWQSATGRIYQIESAPPGGAYSAIASNIAATPVLNVSTVSVSQSAILFRVKLQP